MSPMHLCSLLVKTAFALRCTCLDCCAVRYRFRPSRLLLICEHPSPTAACSHVLGCLQPNMFPIGLTSCAVQKPGVAGAGACLFPIPCCLSGVTQSVSMHTSGAAYEPTPFLTPSHPAETCVQASLSESHTRDTICNLLSSAGGQTRLCPQSQTA